MQSRSLLILGQIARNAAMAVPGVAAWRSRCGRTADVGAEVTRDDLETYAYGPFERVLNAVGWETLTGATVVEIGPGDHIPMAMLLLAAGAGRYICLDRFAGDLGGGAARTFYQALAHHLPQRWPELAAGLHRQGLAPDRFPDSAGDRVCVWRRAVEESPETDVADLVLSNNVVEHVSDLDAFVRHSFKMLRSGGRAVHRVDFTAHDVWAARGDPFEWLTVSDGIWRLTGSHRGSPNRYRYHEVREAVERGGFLIEVDLVEAYPLDLIRSARPRLARRFRGMPVESLAVRTALFVCEKK
ncbi:MAG TPA: methyltransferase domain-containing protein [Myxococcota bacterium]|nr:methyltransferase domain-containing protein [Myxococcota bacterium]